MLRGYDNSVDSYGSAVLGIFDRDLSFSVGSEIGESAVRTDFRQLSGELVGERDGQGHKLRSLAARIAEHHSLVARALTVNAEGDVGGLLVYSCKYSAGVTVEALFGAVIADVADDPARYRGDVYLRARGYLAHYHDHAGRAAALAGNSAVLILGEDSVKDCVGDLVADLIGMSASYGFGCEKVVCHVFVLLLTNKKSAWRNR